MCDVPALRFPEFTGEWNFELLGIIAPNITSGKSKPSLGEYNLYGSTGVIGKTANADYFGDMLLVARVGANAGSLQLVNENCGITDNTLIIKPCKLSSHYLYFYLQHYNLNRLVFGSGQPLITAGMLKKVRIPFGNQLEQRKIERLLIWVDERIATQNKIIEDLKKLMSAIVEKLFAARKGLYVKLGNISSITNGSGDVQDAHTDYHEELFPFFDRSEEQKYFDTYSFDKEAIIYAGEGQGFMPRYYNGKFALHQRCYAITDFADIIVPQYCYHYMKTLNSYFIRNAVGSTVPSLRIDTFQKAPILLLEKETQYKICDCLNCLDDKYNTETRLLQVLMQQKQYLLHSMFI